MDPACGEAVTWQKTKERLAEAAVIVEGLVALVAICLVIFTFGLVANNVLHVVTTQDHPAVCAK